MSSERAEKWWDDPMSTATQLKPLDERAACIGFDAGYDAAARESHERIAKLEQYERAINNHLCEYDKADWLGCTGGHGDYCDICEAEGNDHPHQTLRRVEAERDGYLHQLQEDEMAAEVADLRESLRWALAFMGRLPTPLEDKTYWTNLALAKVRAEGATGQEGQP